MKKKQPAGTLQISHDVVATIAGVAAKEIEGVTGLSHHSPGLKRNPLRKSFMKPVDVIIAEGLVEIDIGIALRFGAQITDVCAKVQSAVKDSVQTMTGMAVSKVNVFVSRITFPENETTAS
jgi:uncharacterized alkaline shock family protein YloU